MLEMFTLRKLVRQTLVSSNWAIIYFHESMQIKLVITICKSSQSK